MTLAFTTETVTARILHPSGELVERPVEIRTHPVTGRRVRIAFSRAAEREPGTQTLPPTAPDAEDSRNCPFCPPRLETQTPLLEPNLAPEGRLRQGRSVLFPNLFPYAAYSAVSLCGAQHYTEIGTARPADYLESLLNCREYLRRVIHRDPEARFVAIVQNHLPAAGGSLVHPHLQVHADRIPPNHHRVWEAHARNYRTVQNRLLLGEYLELEKAVQARYIGVSGPWHWLAAFAPEGFFELWGICPGQIRITDLSREALTGLAQGIVNAQRFYRCLCRNSYNLGLLAVERDDSPLELRAVLTVRANYAPWVRSDRTSFEVMLGDMTTFVAPESVARQAREFWA
jgi:galactose-1-phosphate uridylyltransferase